MPKLPVKTSTFPLHHTACQSDLPSYMGAPASVTLHKGELSRLTLCGRAAHLTRLALRLLAPAPQLHAAVPVHHRPPSASLHALLPGTRPGIRHAQHKWGMGSWEHRFLWCILKHLLPKIDLKCTGCMTKMLRAVHITTCEKS